MIKKDLIPISDEIARVLEIIRAQPGHTATYHVGGQVRDALVHNDSYDTDLEVHGKVDFEKLIRALEEAGFTVSLVGQSFSVITIRLADFSTVDIAPPRRESKTGPGHKGFRVEADSSLTLREACARRDFTINAMAWNSQTGEVFDFFDGINDLKTRTLRHTSPAFTEDPLRVLRGMRFASYFDMRLAPETAELCRSIVDTYDELPRDRVWGEFLKMASKGMFFSAALDFLQASGWDVHFPQLKALQNIPQAKEYHDEDVWTHAGLAANAASMRAIADGIAGHHRAIRVLAALLHDVGKATHTQHNRRERLQYRLDHGIDEYVAFRKFEEEGPGKIRITSWGHAEAGVEPAIQFLESIGAPNIFKTYIIPLIREHMRWINGKPSKASVRKLVRDLSPIPIEDWAATVRADQEGRRSTHKSAVEIDEIKRWVEIAQSLGIEEEPEPPILTGGHLIEYGLKQGPIVGVILKAALKAQDEGAFTDEAGALEWMKEHVTL